MNKEAVFEVNGLVVKGSHEDFYQVWSGRSSIVSNGNGNGNGATKQKVIGLLELRAQRPDEHKPFLQWVVEQNKNGVN